MHAWAAVMWVGMAMVMMSTWWWGGRKTRVHVLPPSPAGELPIIGHMHLLAGSRRPHRLFLELARRHGSLMTLRLGSVRLLVVSSAEMAREVLQRQDAVFASRPRTQMAALVMHGCIGMSPLGALWRSSRLVCTTHLLTRKSLDGFLPIREQEIRGVVESVLAAARAGTPAPIRDLLFTCANNIVCRMAFGFPITASSAAADGHRLVHLVDELSVLLGVSNLGDFLPWLARLDLQGYAKRMTALRRSFDALFQCIIDNAREKRPHQAPAGCHLNLLDTLLSLAEEQKSLPGCDIPISDDNIKALLMEMFFAGTDTWATMAEWVLLELLNSPSTMRTLHEELQSVVGKERAVEEADLPHLPYLHAAVKETFRLHPVAPLLLPHFNTKACQLGTYYIPPNTWTMVNALAVQTDPDVWPDRPSEFVPERFLGNSTVDLLGHNLELIPFGSGRRSCPGLLLGLGNVQFTVASLVHAFDISCSDLPLDTLEDVGTTMRPKLPLSFSAKPRLPMHVY